MTADAPNVAQFPPGADPPDGRRLLGPHPLRELDAHLEWYGVPPAGGRALISDVARSSLRGKGGARFPTATKLAAVAERRRPIVVANGSEGEPASLKDTVLMTRVPHLVLDGVVLAAQSVGAREAIIFVARGSTAQPILKRAINERTASGFGDVAITVAAGPHRYVSGEETALVNWLNHGDAKPTFTPPRPFERGVNGRPTLVQNVETLCDLALIARFGADWYRSIGTADEPGTTLLTVSGAVTRPGVYEVPLGTALGDVITMAGTESASGAVLVGGYFGTWISPSRVARTSLGVASLQAVGGGLGAGVVVVLPRDHVCGLAESARVARWLADENAGQCGPCVNGLDAIAEAMRQLVAGDPQGRAEKWCRRWLDMVRGRGACKHPDGAARFVASSLDAFADEIAAHRKHGPCPRTEQALLPTPTTGGWR
jgi:NADH:ubiquinone oxidoreductase subunit F (NADH-binding)